MGIFLFSTILTELWVCDGETFCLKTCRRIFSSLVYSVHSNWFMMLITDNVCIVDEGKNALFKQSCLLFKGVTA